MGHRVEALSSITRAAPRHGQRAERVPASTPLRPRQLVERRPRLGAGVDGLQMELEGTAGHPNRQQRRLRTMLIGPPQRLIGTGLLAAGPTARTGWAEWSAAGRATREWASSTPAQTG